MKNIVLMADRVADFASESSKSRKFEYTSDSSFDPLFSALCEISPKVYHYDSPSALLDNIAKHSNDIVVTVWSGEKSRNRKAIIQSICEGYNIPYVGADSFLQIISADKHLSKVVCEPYGILGAKDVLISSIDDLWKAKSLKFPVVIKPNLEGGSIGISQDSVALCYEDLAPICEQLLPLFTPLIVEEYLQGEEINVCIAGVNGQIDVFQAVRQNLQDKTFFTSEILSVEVKKINSPIRSTEIVTKDIVTNEFPQKEKEKLIALFNSLGKAEVMRIDGRLFNNEFRLIELTPDCSLSQTASVNTAFQASGYSYPQMFQLLIDNTIKAWEFENTSI